MCSRRIVSRCRTCVSGCNPGRIVFVLWLVLASHAGAELVFDASGATLAGTMTIPADEGILAGTNLLHRFSRFNINAGESATFTGPDAIHTIILGVTGTESSTIDGILRSTIMDADLMLLNPNGILFGSGASIDINGSLYLSTAPRILFEDGSSLVVSDSGLSTLTAAAPSAFGFDASPTGITFNGVEISSAGAGQARGLSIVSGDIQLEDANLSLDGGSFDLVAVGDAMDVPIHPAARTLVPGLADIRMKGGRLDSSGSPPGRIAILGDHLDLSGEAFIFSDTKGPETGPGITIFASSDVTLREGSRITTDALDIGTGGEILITATNIHLSGRNTKIASDTQRTGGSSGRLTIEAGQLLIADEAQLSSRSNSSGDGADISIQVTDLMLTSGSLISGQAIRDGNGADVTINASNQVVIDALNSPPNSASGIAVSSFNLDFFSSEPGGDAGNVSIDSPLLQLINGGRITAESITPNSGAPGTITLNVEELIMTAGSRISTETASLQDAGAIVINSDRLMASGQGTTVSSSTVRSATGGDIRIQAASVSISSGAGLAVDTQESGAAGSISLVSDELNIVGGELDARTLRDGMGGAVQLVTNSLLLDQGGRIDTSSQGSGAAGSIDIRVDADLDLRGDSVISSATAGPGAGGSIFITARNLSLSDAGSSGPTPGGGRIDTSATGSGDAGSIVLSVLRALILEGSQSRITSTTETGLGGSIRASATDIQLLDRARIDVNSTGSGFAGNIDIEASHRLEVTGQARIKTDSIRSGGGNISVNAVDRIVLLDSELTASAGGEGPFDNGGNVTIDPVFLILGNSRILAQAFAGNGGMIHLQAEQYISDSFSIIDATSELGNDGDVRISAPDNGVTGVLGILNAGYRDERELLRDSCAARAMGDRSSLVDVSYRQAPGLPQDLAVNSRASMFFFEACLASTDK